VSACAACGSENREGARYCDACGEKLTAVEVREQRKTVTVLFCDVTGSTALGERLDPESLRSVLARYFEVASAAIERHGGTVEKFIGDAVMAVFGVPVLHEDDALRAVRAAAEVQAGVAALNDELERDFGTTLAVRIGVATGEVVTGTAERLATGDTVNVAARLEQAAQPGEVLLGEETLRLVRGAVEAEPVEPLAVEGKALPLPASRLVRVSADAPARAHGAPFVGRDRERRLLADAWERARAERSPHLFTLLGSAGVGKSRLTAEFLAGLDDATVVRGRCLSYGEGITYWPAVEILVQLLGREPAERIAGLDLDETAAAALLGLLGQGEQPASPEVAAWSFRKLLEAVAERAPVVVQVDDLQWAEPTLLDLVEHIADLSRGAPIFLLCLARPDLLDQRPGWGGGKLNATTALLEPLGNEESEQLVESLLRGESLAGDARARVVAASGGNPLFVEELLALLRERGDGELELPPTIQALLAARIDQLDPSERGVLERGSVEGEIFHRGAVEALAGGEPDVPARLAALVRKELVRPERAQLRGDDAYRFRHLLIRDAAYEALPKAVRAELHERFADWLEKRGGDLVELDEILGYHLEQAHRYRVELGPPDERSERLAERARERLVAAAYRAGQRGDEYARASLVSRAVELAPAEAGTVRLRLRLAEHLLFLGDVVRAADVAEEALSLARAAGDRGAELLAQWALLKQRYWMGTEDTRAELEAFAAEAIPLFEQVGDDEGLVEAWRAIADVEFGRGRFADCLLAKRRALEHARRTGNTSEARFLLAEMGSSLFYGPTAVAELLHWQEEHRWLEPTRPTMAVVRGATLGLLGRFDDGREAIGEAEHHGRELGVDGVLARAALELGELELLAGNTAEGVRQLRTACELIERLGRLSVLSTWAAQLARALLALECDDEAEGWSIRSERLGADDDVVTQVLWRQTRARVLARRGEHDAARRLAAEAVELADSTDMLIQRGHALADLAEVLELGGDVVGAAAALERALAEYERKGVPPAVEQARARLAALGS
jgi:class 3 adenylate cyclase/tetratricopeptide (TPR) repeat protein